VRASDSAYLASKWRPGCAPGFGHGPSCTYFLIEMDCATDQISATAVGHETPWMSLTATWAGERTLHFTAVYMDEFGLNYGAGVPTPVVRNLVAELSADGAELTWVNGTDFAYGSSQLFTHVTWYRCEMLPKKCTEGAVRYPDFASMSPIGMNMANTPHFRGSKFHTQLVMGRRYQFDLMTKVGIAHLEATTVHAGQAMVDGEWVEVATNPYGAYPKTTLPPGIRPIGALPSTFKLNGIDGVSYTAKRIYDSEDDTFGGRRRLMTASISYNPDTEQAIMRLIGPPNCLQTRWYDPCGGVVGSFKALYAPPPSPPPPSPPLPPPPPPTPPPMGLLMAMINARVG